MGLVAATSWTPVGASGAVLGASACAVACASLSAGIAVFVPGVCFADGTLVTLADSKNSTIRIEEVVPGTKIWTFDEGAWFAVDVLSNQRREGSFQMVEISVYNSQSEQTETLTVTEDHLMVRGPTKDQCSENLISDFQGIAGSDIVVARGLSMGDLVPVGNFWGEIVGVKTGLEHKFRNELITSGGSVLANGIVTTTGCGGLEKESFEECATGLCSTG